MNDQWPPPKISGHTRVQVPATGNSRGVTANYVFQFPITGSISRRGSIKTNSNTQPDTDQLSMGKTNLFVIKFLSAQYIDFTQLQVRPVAAS